MHPFRRIPVFIRGQLHDSHLRALGERRVHVVLEGFLTLRRILHLRDEPPREETHGVRAKGAQVFVFLGVIPSQGQEGAERQEQRKVKSAKHGRRTCPAKKEKKGLRQVALNPVSRVVFCFFATQKRKRKKKKRIGWGALRDEQREVRARRVASAPLRDANGRGVHA